MDIGFIGLGQMGQGMAARLIERGHRLVVWNRSPAAAQALRERGAHITATPAQVLDAEIVISMLADDAAVDAVWVSSNLASQMRKDALHLNMASVSLAMGKRLEAVTKPRLPSTAIPSVPFQAPSGSLPCFTRGSDES